ncbi:hydrogenase iron-sulfur subunit [Rhodoferax sp.]|uniref:hydrogenase iron-sulfur subunit n=1 Tax=Rhodoferax sp. TaxID=50421 RepID=UPI00284E92F7|nr:hydrogenase iron-sulfur subunit [Rhodoferax sp.]MDR3370430.1 hydrogenase iron-sulfur subunit [Rhodoferax sp.]
MSAADSKHTPKILVFSTNAISDPGIDQAGSAHLHYSTAVQVIPLPCSSGIKPTWIVHALERGFDGVFIAACGGDCAYLTDCTTRTSTLVARAQTLMKEHGISPKRLKMAGLCSVCADNFVVHMNKYQQELQSLEA